MKNLIIGFCIECISLYQFIRAKYEKEIMCEMHKEVDIHNVYLDDDWQGVGDCSLFFKLKNYENIFR